MYYDNILALIRKDKKVEISNIDENPEDETPNSNASKSSYLDLSLIYSDFVK